MTRIESATEHLHIAIESLLKAICETCVNDGAMSFREAGDLAEMTTAVAMTKLGMESFAHGLKAGIEYEQSKQPQTY